MIFITSRISSQIQVFSFLFSNMWRSLSSKFLKNKNFNPQNTADSSCNQSLKQWPPFRVRSKKTKRSSILLVLDLLIPSQNWSCMKPQWKTLRRSCKTILFAQFLILQIETRMLEQSARTSSFRLKNGSLKYWLLSLWSRHSLTS